jgi:hypothetical protein
MKAHLAKLDAGGEFIEGHQLDAKTVKRVPKKAVGRCLSSKEAGQILQRLSVSDKKSTSAERAARQKRDK